MKISFDKRLLPLYGINFARDLNLISVLLSPLMIASELTLGDYAIVVGAFRGTQMIFSIPCGWVSDRIRPKVGLQIASALFLLSCLPLLLTKLALLNFVVFNSLNALSVCFMIPSSNKYLKEMRLNVGEFTNAYSTKISLRKLGAFCSGGVAAFIYGVFSGFEIVVGQLTIAVLLLSLSFALEKTDNVISGTRLLNENPLSVFVEIRNSSFFRVLYFAFPFFVTIDLMLQPLIVAAGVTKWFFPIIISVVNFAIFLSINQSKKIHGMIQVPEILQPFLAMLPLFLYSITGSAIISLIAIVITILTRSTSVVEMAQFLREISPGRQGVVESIFNTTLMLLLSGTSFSFGFFVKTYSIQTATGILFVALTLFSFLFYAASPRKISERTPSVKCD